MSKEIDYEQLAKNLAKENAELKLRVSGSFREKVKKLLIEYRDEQMPEWNTPYHYDTEGWASMEYFIKWLNQKSNDC